MTKKINKLPESAMTEKRFWELVEMADWPNKGYDKPKMIYRKTLSKEECGAFNHMIAIAYNLLEKVDSGQVDYCGDDSYSDLLHHIIGLGKKEFYRHANNVKLMKERAENSQYKESFAYCVPYDGDYEEKTNPYTITHVVCLAKSSQEVIERFRKMDKRYGDDNGTFWLNPIYQELADIDMLMENFIDNPTEEGLKELASAKSWIKKATDKIDKFFEKNKMELPRKFTDNGHNGMCTPLFSNTVKDAESALEYLK